MQGGIAGDGVVGKGRWVTEEAVASAAVAAATAAAAAEAAAALEVVTSHLAPHACCCLPSASARRGKGPLGFDLPQDLHAARPA